MTRVTLINTRSATISACRPVLLMLQIVFLAINTTRANASDANKTIFWISTQELALLVLLPVLPIANTVILQEAMAVINVYLDTLIRVALASPVHQCKQIVKLVVIRATAFYAQLTMLLMVVEAV